MAAIKFKFASMTVPENAHPMVKRLFAEMIRQRCTMMLMAKKTGIGRITIKNWKHNSNPKLTDLIACLNVLGFDLKIIKVKDPE